MNFNQIQKCLTANVIDEHEAFAIEAWMSSIDLSVDNIVPDGLFDMIEKMDLYLNPTVGGVQ